MDGFYRQVTRILKDAGCSFARQGRGDHEMWYSPITKSNFVVDRGMKSRHTANAALKQAGVKVRV